MRDQHPTLLVARIIQAGTDEKDRARHRYRECVAMGPNILGGAGTQHSVDAGLAGLQPGPAGVALLAARFTTAALVETYVMCTILNGTER